MAQAKRCSNGDCKMLLLGSEASSSSSLSAVVAVAAAGLIGPMLLLLEAEEAVGPLGGRQSREGGLVFELELVTVGKPL